MAAEDRFVSNIASLLYALEARSIESLAQMEFDWRGIYRLQDSDGRRWVLRMMRLPEALDSYRRTARLLEWLVNINYRAPVVRRTRRGELAGSLNGWAVLLVSYIEGIPLGTDAVDLGHLAQTTGRLHASPRDPNQASAGARCHPAHLDRTIERLARHSRDLPGEYRSFAEHLYHSIIRLQQRVQDALTLTHGDCWYGNAIQTDDGQVVLVDWDNAGLGVPLLELGTLLLSSHFDLRQPLRLAPNEGIIRMIMEAYQRERPLASQELSSLGDALRFLPAFQLGLLLEDAAPSRRQDFEFLLQKLQVRSNVTEDIFAKASKYWVET